MSGQNQGQVARRTGGGKIADFGLAPTAQISASRQIAVTGAQIGLGLDDARRESHLEKRRLIASHGFGIGGASDGRRCDGHQQLAEVHFVRGDIVAIRVAGVGLLAYFGTDVHLRRQSDDAHADFVLDARLHRIVNIRGIGSVQSAENDDHFTSAVGGGVMKHRPCGIQGELNGRIPLRLVPAQSPDGVDVIVGVAGHVADGHGNSIAHSNDAQLRDGILLKKLLNEGDAVRDGQQVACGP